MNSAKNRRNFIGLTIPILLIIFLSTPAAGLTLKERLEQQTNFIPQEASPLDQLVEVAQQFNIPMAIEWFEQASEKSKPSLLFNGGSVLDLIKAIVQRSPSQQLLVQERSLYIFAPKVVSHPFNFLNLSIQNYSVKNESVFGAEFRLRISINSLLYPELYRHGSNGGYGGDPDSIFWKPKITFKGHQLTIRQILTKIIEESGYALWIVRLQPEEFAGDKPKWLGIPIDESGNSPLNGRWHFIRLQKEGVPSREQDKSERPFSPVEERSNDRFTMK